MSFPIIASPAVIAILKPRTPGDLRAEAAALRTRADALDAEAVEIEERNRAEHARQAAELAEQRALTEIAGGRDWWKRREVPGLEAWAKKALARKAQGLPFEPFIEPGSEPAPEEASASSSETETTTASAEPIAQELL